MTSFVGEAVNSVQQKVHTVGLDYSMSCPCLCLCEGDIRIENCRFYFLTDIKKYVGEFSNGKYQGTIFPDYSSEEERFHVISEHFIKILSKIRKDVIIGNMNIEGYAMGAKGRVFAIGENTGVIKHKLYLYGIQFNIVPPTVIKKFATGKGNSDKNIMYDFFLTETKTNLKEIFGYNKTSIGSPIGDIVDSYYICKYSPTTNTIKNGKT